MAEFESFLGRGWGFPPSFSQSGQKIRMAEDEDDIRESLHILLCTTIGERILQPKYGCNLQEYIFEPNNANLQAVLQDIVSDAIFYFEPRVEPLGITLENAELEGKITIEVEYKIRTTNSRQNLVFPFFLNEGTNIEA